MTRPAPRVPSPTRWLWDEIARRFGEDAARQLKLDFDEQNRAYHHAKWHDPESPDSSKVRPGRKRLKR